jgi:hypothetical protein
MTPINKTRGRLIDLDEEIKALVTVHPSYLLRLPDADAKAREYEHFVSDLKVAATLLGNSCMRHKTRARLRNAPRGALSGHVKSYRSGTKTAEITPRRQG